MANIVLGTKTYTGRGIANLIASWVDAATGLIASFASLTGSVRLPQGKETKANIQWRLKIPVTAAEASACACPGDVIDEIDAYVQVRCTKGVPLTIRTEMADQLADLVASTEFQSSITNFQQPTG